MTNTAADQYPVFILEDLAENRKAAEEFFSSIGIPVVFATTFEEAKTVLEAQNAIFRACIFDVHVPLHDGCVPVNCSLYMEKVAVAHPYIFATAANATTTYMMSNPMQGPTARIAAPKSDIRFWRCTWFSYFAK